jgi:hypothetical protein
LVYPATEAPSVIYPVHKNIQVNGSPEEFPTNAKRRLGRYALVAVVGLLAILPIWIPAFPAMVDVPQHAAQTAIYARLTDPSFRFAPLFVRHTLTPNLAGYVPLLLLGPLVGLVAATKLVMSIGLVCFLLTGAWLIEEFGSDARLALLAVPGLSGFPFQWGFLSFVSAAPVGICFLIAYLRYFRRPTLGRGAALMAFFGFVFFCHAMVAAFAAGLAMAFALVGVRSARELAVRWMPVLGTVPVAGLWWAHSVIHNPFSLSEGWLLWPMGWDRVPEFFTNIVGWPCQTTLDDCMAAFWVLLAVVPLMLLLGLRRKIRYYVLFSCCAGVMLLAPDCIMHVTFIYKRFAIFALPFAALALKPMAAVTRRRAKLAMTWLLVISLGWTALLAQRMRVFEREAHGFATVLAQMEPGNRALALSCIWNASGFEGAVFLHFPAWYSALKGGITDVSFAEGNVNLVNYRPDAMPAVRFSDFEWHPWDFRWAKHEGWRYRYFVVHDKVSRAELFADAPVPVVLRAHDGDWWLWENTSGR